MSDDRSDDRSESGGRSRTALPAGGGGEVPHSMTNPNTVNWYEIPTTDLDRAARFYETLLGVTLKREAMGGQELAIFKSSRTGGVGGALVKDARRKPSSGGTLVYLDTRGDLDGAIARTAPAGGQVLVPKTDIGEMGAFAIVLDTEGNAVGIHAEK